MLQTKNGTKIDEKKLKEIAAGGEGSIREYTKKTVLKIYHSPRKPEFAKHLESLSTLSDVFVKPLEVLYITKGDVAGFEMKYVPMNNFFLFNNLFNKGFCSSNGITRDFKIAVLGKLRKAVEELHSKNIQVGDLNMYNLAFSLKGELVIMDVDSYQTPTQPHSLVLLEEIRDFTKQHIDNQTDIWAYDILAFWSCCFMHPFKYVAPGNKETLEQRVRQGKSVLSKIPNIKIPALYEPPAKETENQFREIFSGRRYFVDFSGSHSPVNLVIKQNISSSALNIRELFNHVTDMNVCGDFIVVKRNNEWLSVETKLPKVTRELLPSTLPMYPSNSKVVYIVGNTLKHSSGEINFIQPEFFYYNGFLTVIDYGTDIQYNFNLNNQLGGIDHRQTPIFAKSIIIRDTPIQNFGGKKYLNIPSGNSYTLIEVPLGTKNAIYNGAMVGTEYTEKNQIKYRISSVGHNAGMDLDYLPFFTVNKGTLFLPEDGKIDVHKDFSLIASLDAPMCSRSSKLYSCNSGILLLENNILYLLNTK